MNEMKLLLGGQERPLLFGKVGFFEYAKTATGTDPLLWLAGLDEWTIKLRENPSEAVNHIGDIAIMVYAGLNTHADFNDLPNYTFEQARKWTNGLDVPELADVLITAINSISPPAKPGEAQAPEEKNLPGTDSGEKPSGE
jgi:hypothetical protein